MALSFASCCRLWTRRSSPSRNESSPKSSSPVWARASRHQVVVLGHRPPGHSLGNGSTKPRQYPDINMDDASTTTSGRRGYDSPVRRRQMAETRERILGRGLGPRARPPDLGLARADVPRRRRARPGERTHGLPALRHRAGPARRGHAPTRGRGRRLVRGSPPRHARRRRRARLLVALLVRGGALGHRGPDVRRPRTNCVATRCATRSPRRRGLDRRPARHGRRAARRALERALVRTPRRPLGPGRRTTAIAWAIDLGDRAPRRARDPSRRAARRPGAARAGGRRGSDPRRDRGSGGRDARP